MSLNRGPDIAFEVSIKKAEETYLLLDTRYQILDTRRYIPINGYQILGSGYWILYTNSKRYIPITRYQKLGSGYWIQYTRYLELDIKYYTVVLQGLYLTLK